MILIITLQFQFFHRTSQNQLMKLKNTLRHLRGEDLITHLGLEYYD